MYNIHFIYIYIRYLSPAEDNRLSRGILDGDGHVLEGAYAPSRASRASRASASALHRFSAILFFWCGSSRASAGEVQIRNCWFCFVIVVACWGIQSSQFRFLGGTFVVAFWGIIISIISISDGISIWNDGLRMWLEARIILELNGIAGMFAYCHAIALPK